MICPLRQLLRVDVLSKVRIEWRQTKSGSLVHTGAAMGTDLTLRRLAMTDAAGGCGVGARRGPPDTVQTLLSEHKQSRA